MLSLNAVGRVFPGGQQALTGISLEIPQGGIVALVGGSGCGKTTLLRLIAGLDRPSAGSISVDGKEITGPSEEVGIIFQEPRLLPWLSVEDNIGFPLAALPVEERRARVDRALLRVGLGGLGKRWPRELSGGQAQRVSIARSLIARPKVLLLDEPFSALDAFTRASLHDHLIALWEAERPTLVIVTHDVEEAAILGDRVVVMQPHPGRIFTEFKIDLPRPRDRLDDAFHATKRKILKALDGSLANHHPSANAGADSPAANADATSLWW